MTLIRMCLHSDKIKYLCLQFMFTHICLTSLKSLKWRSTERRAESQQPRTKTKTCTSLAADRNSEWRADSATSSACSSTRYSQSSCIAMCRWEIWKQWQRRASAVMTARLAWSAIFWGFIMTHDHEAWRNSNVTVNDAFDHVDDELLRWSLLLLLIKHVRQQKSTAIWRQN